MTHITKDIFNAIIESTENQIKNIENSQIIELQNKFPYCEIIHNISLLKAHFNNDINFTTTLAKSGLYSSNRKNLFDLIHSKSNIKKTQRNINKTTYLFEEWLNDRIRPHDTENEGLIQTNITESTQDNNFLITETLAKIYIEQGHYKRAIQAYEILCLKYPKKSSFFANRIQDIKTKKN